MALTRLIPFLALVVLTPAAVDANDAAARAWTLYANANYEDALTILNHAESESLSASERQTLREYRALCFLALEQTADATSVIRQMLDADIFYAPDFARRPPRFTALYVHMRRERAQMLAHDEYVRATRAFDEGRLGTAEAHLTLVQRLTGLVRADVVVPQETTGNSAWLYMLETQTAQFLDTIRAHAGGSAGQAIAEPGVFDSTNQDVMPPVPISQDIPDWPGTGSRAFEGALSLTINESGNVVTASLRESIHPDYDPVLLKAARAWTFRAAVRDGKPVRYRTVIAIRVSPQRRSTAAR